MRRQRRPPRRLGAVAVTGSLLLAALPLLAPSESKAQIRPAEPDPGDLLIASRELDDASFAETVVLLLDIGPDGSAGVVINRPTPIRVASVLRGIEALAGRADTLRWGGPVEPGSALLLARLAEPPLEGELVHDDVYVVRTRSGIEELLRRGVPEASLRVFTGYTGWNAGQLEWEIANGSWHLRRADPARIFDDDPRSLWERLVRIARSPIARSALDHAGPSVMASSRRYTWVR